jgi:diadenosine tetraphosphate (Ap4A) HIT family hydrolase
MHHFSIDARLAADCYHLGSCGDADILLMNNAHYPWFIIVPHTRVIEYFQLEATLQQHINTLIKRLSVHIKTHYQVDKLNVASIGNLVAQLHVHLVGRRVNDPAWPGVVWGHPQRMAYADAAVIEIRTQLVNTLGGAFVAAEHLNK